MTERWLPVVGWSNYEVSDRGRVRSLDHQASNRFWRGRILRQTPLNGGHLMVRFSQDGRLGRETVHCLVLTAFVGPRPEGMECRHLNDDPTDNRLENLVWGTRSENLYDAIRNGKRQVDKSHCKRGHQFTPDNTYLYNGRKVCCECRLQSKRAYNARKRQEVST